MKLLPLLLLLLSPGLLFGQATAPKYSNEFLSIGIGARALGMGRTQTAVVNDVTAGYWNPAGLLDITTRTRPPSCTPSILPALPSMITPVLPRPSTR
jgi:hypothetical protein